MEPTWLNKKKAPWGPLGGPWAPTLLPEAREKIVVGGLGASWGKKLVDFKPPGVPGKPPEGPGRDLEGSFSKVGSEFPLGALFGPLLELIGLTLGVLGSSLATFGVFLEV